MGCRPESLLPEELRRRIMETEPAVHDIHHIHIWALSTTENALTAHVVIDSAEEEGRVKAAVKHDLAEMGITHSTLEFEYPGGNACSAGECHSCR